MSVSLRHNWFCVCHKKPRYSERCFKKIHSTGAVVGRLRAQDMCPCAMFSYLNASLYLVFCIFK